MERFHIGIASGFNSVILHTEDGPVQDVVDYFYILADHASGKRWVLTTEGADYITSVEEAECILRGLDHDPETNPDVWGPTFPCYGSDAWDDDAERELAAFEADCFNEPRPRW